MVTLVMYSDQVIPENQKVDLRLLELMAGRGRRIGYVSSGPEPDRRYYREKQAYYAMLNLDLAVFFDTGAPVEQSGLAALLGCDAIHLAGGDTRAFLHLLKANGLFARLVDWAVSGGLLVGTSAGAILMTPTVALDALFNNEDPAAVREGAALDLVGFEFFPHLGECAEFLPQLLAYSVSTPRMIAACRDGDGVIVNGDVVECIGDVVWIADGAIVNPPAIIR